MWAPMARESKHSGALGLAREDAKALSDFLAERLEIDPASLPAPSRWAGSGNTIGALALRLGVLTLDQVEQAVDLQASDGQLLGEIVRALGYCTDVDIERLLALQRLHRCLDQAALLVMSGQMDMVELLEALAAFASERGI